MIESFPRKVAVAGALLLAGTALAGCSNTDGTPSWDVAVDCPADSVPLVADVSRVEKPDVAESSATINVVCSDDEAVIDMQIIGGQGVAEIANPAIDTSNVLRVKARNNEGDVVFNDNAQTPRIAVESPSGDEGVMRLTGINSIISVTPLSESAE